jgi:hypothetical protein
MGAPKWAKGMERIAAGLYYDKAEGALHFDTYELCEVARVPYTEENCAWLRAMAEKTLAETGWGNIPFDRVDDPD